MVRILASVATVTLLVLASSPGGAGEPVKPKFNIKITGDSGEFDGAGVLDPLRRINVQAQGNFYVGITTLQNQALHLSHFPQFMIDRQVFQPGQGDGRIEVSAAALKPLRGKARTGFTSVWALNNLRITQTMEVHPSKPKTPKQKRLMNTVFVSYSIENKGPNARSVGARVCMDTYVVTNQGCLFAAPTLPMKILDGIVLQGKTLPDYVQMLQRADLANPGFVSHLSLDVGPRYEKMDKVILSSAQVGFGEWEMPVAQAGGDSAISFYWATKNIKPGEKRELAYAYGEGIAVPPVSEGLFQMSLGGSFEPGKSFTISAVVGDPAPGQSLVLELPKGVDRLEGRAVQSVPHLAEDQEYSTVLWKARITEPGEHPIRIRSSTGQTQTKIVTVSAVK